MPVGPRMVFYFPSTTYWKINRSIPRSSGQYLDPDKQQKPNPMSRLWIVLSGKEATDELAGSGCDFPNPSSSVLNHSEIHPLHKPPSHHWYAAYSRGLYLQCRRSRFLFRRLWHA
ncbi:hypothetical protein TNCV_1137671 [Trichonephila clavipes]|nr:hypothetical protein TNCV_1137671 [Trichonephila clavipes]